MEAVFRYSSNIRLLELLNLDQPILRELMLVAPGTYHHSLVVGQMVEAAAEAIGANPMLAKAAAYYHDVGKIKKPVYFVENQMAGENKHEKLAPSMSSLILIAHVKDGVELARKQHLGEAICRHHPAAPRHQLHQLFLSQGQGPGGQPPDRSKSRTTAIPVPGPKPRKPGLVLLADQVEAASKTLTRSHPGPHPGHGAEDRQQCLRGRPVGRMRTDPEGPAPHRQELHKILGGIFHQRIQLPPARRKEKDS